MRACPHCKGERETCEDSDVVWHLRRDVCHKTVALEAVKRLHHEEYKDQPWHDGTGTTWAKEFSAETPNHYMDGVSIWVADTPDPKFVKRDDD